MATLQKFKLLATQCAIATSPTRISPTTSPVFQLRPRRKTLRMLLSRSGTTRRINRHQEEEVNVVDDDDSLEEEKKSLISNKLKDLFLSSSSPPSGNGNGNNKVAEKIIRDNGEVLIDRVRKSIVRRHNGSGSYRGLSAAFRCVAGSGAGGSNGPIISAGQPDDEKEELEQVLQQHFRLLDHILTTRAFINVHTGVGNMAFFWIPFGTLVEQINQESQSSGFSFHSN
ncbi:hypothetical protein IFM89_004823 [Coptis chinensis]|uniref:Uncharacterized protein n=1 Tax=Coptis chinensis TaxID=261450 RepID=A0A835LH55_9MAGN|nr:hypothetical protein IFM89_004823 [Coptis chinensis]